MDAPKNDYETGQRVYSITSCCGVSYMRELFLEILEQHKQTAVSQLPDFWQGWLAQYLEEEEQSPNSRDEAFFRAIQGSSLGRCIEKTDVDCDYCDGTGKELDDGIRDCLVCGGKGKVRRWALV
jgi:hypothetical protein